MNKINSFIFGIFLLVSCSKDTATNPEVIEKPIEDVWSVNKNNQYALNVVIFKPTDGTIEEDMVDNVSNVMLYVQKWYEKQMELNGYGKKTFGLVTNQQGKAKVTIVDGLEPSTYYADNSRDVNKEVNQYFDDNPDEKMSNHTFVLGKKDSGVPFYGLGKNAFATSSDFVLTSTGEFIGDLELMICDKLGGIMHELGHGLNLPHCAHKASDLPKIALMSFGNHTYQKDGKSSLVFLTASDCAILNVSETFNKKDKLYYDDAKDKMYYDDAEIKLESFSVQKDNAKQATIVQGFLTSNVKANHFYVGHNGYPLEGGYDNITFTTPLSATNKENEFSFSLEMPYTDIFNGFQAKDIFELSLVVVLDNGLKSILYKYDYTIDALSPEPNEDIEKEYEAFVLSDRSEWVITANTNTTSNPAAQMLDGNLDTYWHSIWPYVIADKGAHVITIDMSEAKTFEGVYLLSDRSGGQFRPKHVILETSNDGSTWNNVQQNTIATIGEAREVMLNFDTTVTSQYLRLTIDEVYVSSGTEENLIFTEVDIIE